MRFSSRRYINLFMEFAFSWFKLRDQRTVLGFAWSFLNPLLMSAILYFLFRSRIQIQGEKNYFLYILIGIVSWNFFVTAVQFGISVLTQRAGMVKNVAFPKEILIFSQIGVYLIQHFFEILTVFLFLVVGKVGFSLHVLFLPAVILIECAMIAGVTLILACLCAYAYDIVHIWSVISRMAFFLVPIFYKVPSLSREFRWIVSVNPMTQIINFYRDILLYHTLPELVPFAATAIFAFLLFGAGYKIFKMCEYKIAERV